ncbi:MAG: hypothetical protein AAF649_05070 [Verrucomicrobiota bacterium]
MMSLFHRPLRLLGIGIAIATLFTGYQVLFRPDPQVVFQNEIKQMIATVNQGSYGKIEKKLSEPFIEMLSDQTGMTARQAVLLARRRDMDGSHQYRLANNPVFNTKQYAEVEIDRSGRGRDFDNAYRFSVPFIWVDGEWKIAGGFQTQRSWESPF